MLGWGRTYQPLTDEAAMLVLTRKENEAIVIDGGIRIVVTQIGNGRVRIGVEAPADVPVNRAEIAARMEDELVEVG